MCVRTKLDIDDIREINNRFHAEFQEEIYPAKEYKGHDFPKTPIITSAEPNKIQLFEWGLIMPEEPTEPTPDKRHFGLNARIENLPKRFAKIPDQRCLVLLNGYYEFQYLTKSGSRKQKYILHLPNNELFACAGMWSQWTPACRQAGTPNGEKRYTFSIVTCRANEIVAPIHNASLDDPRMLVILNREQESEWLSGAPLVPDMHIPLIGERVDKWNDVLPEANELRLF